MKIIFKVRYSKENEKETKRKLHNMWYCWNWGNTLLKEWYYYEEWYFFLYKNKTVTQGEFCLDKTEKYKNLPELKILSQFTL